MRVKTRSFLIGSIVISISGWLIGLTYFCNDLPLYTSINIISTDAIVILTGGKGRIKTGLSLFDQGLAKKLFISGVNPHVKTYDFLPSEYICQNTSKNKATYIGYKAYNTSQNAQEIAEWVKLHNIKTIRLVSSPYHLKRSLLEVTKLLPEVKFIPHPSHKTNFFNIKGLLFLISEYNKYIGTYIKLKFL